VAELAPNDSLRDHLLRIEESDGVISSHVSLEIGRQVCSGMDLAARNVLVFVCSSESHLKIHVKMSDFRLSQNTSKA